MLLRLVVFLLLLACGSGPALAQGNGRPTRPPGWEFRPAQGQNPPAFAYDPCPGCYDEDLSFLIVSCPAGELAQVMVQPPDRTNSLQRLEGRTVDVILEVDGQRYALRGKLEGGPNASLLAARLDPNVPLIGALAAARRLRMVAPGNAGSVELQTQRSGAVIQQWQQACGLAPAAATAPSQPTPSATPAVPTSVSDQVLRQRVARFLAANYDGMTSANYRLTLRDLNGDGVAEAFVEVTSGDFCGARACQAMILDVSGPTGREILSIIDMYGRSLRPLPSRTDGWADIAVSRGEVLRWRGNAYGLSP